MNSELPKLELKREELESRLATVRLKGYLVGVNTISLLLCQCHEKISAARDSDVVKGVSKRRTSHR